MGQPKSWPEAQNSIRIISRSKHNYNFGTPTDHSDTSNGKKYKGNNEVYITMYHKKRESWYSICPRKKVDDFC